MTRTEVDVPVSREVMRGSCAWLFALVVAAALTGCSSGPRNFENDNDTLRRENMELRRKVETLQRDIDLRLAEIKRLESQATARPAIEGAKIPQVVVLRFDRYTGGADTDNDGGDDTLRVYIKPMDQRGRFIVVAGSATLQAVAITPGQPPVLVVEKTLSPAEWDAAYRTGMTGTHYSIEAALPRPLPEGVTELTVKVTLTDAAGGATISQEQAVKLRRAAAK